MYSKSSLFSLVFAVIGFANAQVFSGDGTFYHPGLGSCGLVHTDSDFIAALNAPQYDQAPPCGRRIRVTFQGRSVDVTIVDRCAGCSFGDVDLSPTAFAAISDPSAGRIPITWQYI